MDFKKISAVVMVVLLAVSVGTAGVVASESSDQGFLPNDGDDSGAPSGATDDAQTQSHPTGEWSLLIDDGQNGDETGLGIDTIYAQHTSDTLYFKAEYHGDFSSHDEIDLGYFLDTDRDRTTGLNDSTDGWYYMSDIGADYVGVAGFEGDGVWEWSNSSWNDNYDSFTYSDFDYANDTVVIGIDRASLGDPESVDLIAANAMTSPLDYAPDKGEGSVTYEFTTPDDGSDNETDEGAVASLSPNKPTVSPSSTTTIDIAVNNTGDIGAYNFNLSVDDTSSIKIADITLNGNPGVQNATISTDGSTASANAALAEVDGTGNAVLAEVTLEGNQPGSSLLTATVNTIGDVEGNGYNISDATTSTTVDVQAGPGDVTGNGNAATDPDGDGVYEDINGDGSANVLDVQSFFGNLNSDSVQGNPAFDMNGDGSVDILDIQALFIDL